VRWLLLFVPVGAAVLLLAALGHHVTETRQALQAAQAQIAALQAERSALVAERDAAKAAAARSASAPERLSGAPASGLGAGAAVAGSATVSAVLAPNRYLVRLQPATAELVLRYPAPARLRVGQSLVFSGTLAAEAGPRGVPQVDVAPGATAP